MASNTTGNQKAVKFQISRLKIGEWTRSSIYPDDLVSKCYFKKKKLIWEFLDDVETARRLKKIQIQWGDVLSLRRMIRPLDQSGILELELRNRPTFFMETDTQPGKQTQWQQMDQDFTINQSASRYRRHTLEFGPGVLQEKIEKLVSGDIFWSELVKVPFPTLPVSLYFEQYGNSNNHVHTVNNDLIHPQSQGFGRVEVAERKCDTKQHFCYDDGRHMGTFVENNNHNNTMTELLVTQAIPPSSQQQQQQQLNEHSRNPPAGPNLDEDGEGFL